MSIHLLGKIIFLLIKNSRKFFRGLFTPFLIKESDGIIFFGFNGLSTYEKELKKEGNVLFSGISYCQKPLHCKVRFSPECNKCGCFVGRAGEISEILKETRFSNITTSYKLALDLLETINNNPQKEIFFLITACPLSIKMFSRWASILNIKGAAFPLKGGVCMSKKDFKRAEKGIKPGKTELCREKEDLFLTLLKLRSCVKSLH